MKVTQQLVLLALVSACLSAQSPPTGQSPQSDPARSGQGMPAVGMNDAGMYLMNLASGTSDNPQSGALPMIMTTPASGWDVMFMANGFLTDTQESGPRGGDKLFSTNWFMAAFDHPLSSKSAFEADIMLSLEPATVTGRRYPEFFETGETAFGKALIDAQHPHNFVMALGFHYTRKLAPGAILDLYFAPVGDPALGPVAFPHRASASELPEAPLSHHLQDSTHIADEVVTAGISYRQFKLEASGFYGAEPNENRWTIETGPINSWSTRLWYFPSANWAAQVSVGRLDHPEALVNGDQIRSTASLSYSRPLASGGTWSSSLIWGRNHDTDSGHNLNSYLAESVVPLGRRNFVTGRFELVDKDELAIPGVFRIGAYTLGYTRDVDLFGSAFARRVETGIGAGISTYSLPDSLKPVYGGRPLGGEIFVRFHLRSQG